MGENTERNAPSSTEMKLIIDNSLLELEKRMTKSISDTLSEQNRTYMAQIVEMTDNIATLRTKVNSHEEKIKSFKGLVGTVSAISAALSGLITFLIAQLTGGK